MAFLCAGAVCGAGVGAVTAGIGSAINCTVIAYIAKAVLKASDLQVKTNNYAIFSACVKVVACFTVLGGVLGLLRGIFAGIILESEHPRGIFRSY